LADYKNFAVKIQLITNLLLSVSLTLQNLHPYVITRSLEIMRMRCWSLNGVLILLYYSNIRIFFGR